MAAPTLVLEKRSNGHHQVILKQDGEEYIISDELRPSLAIQSAREQGYEDHIYFGSGVAVASDRDVYSETEIIYALADLAGMKIRCAYDNQFRIIGYTMEPKDQELREFLVAEHAAEKLEDEIVGAMGSYMEDE